jgi:PAS domain S-box-containing protein
LEQFAPLLGPGVSLAVSDAAYHLLASNRPFPPEAAAAIREAVTDEMEISIGAQGAVVPICVEEQKAGMIMACGPLPGPDQTRAVLNALKHSLETVAGVALERRAAVREALDRYQEINLLYILGETLATCLDVDELPRMVLTEASQIIHARQGVVLLYDESGEKLVTAASAGSAGRMDAVTGDYAMALAENVARTGAAQIVNDANPDGTGPPTPLLAVPLLVSDELHLGVILLADKAGDEIFTAGDEKLLLALAWQAAISLENARLFDSVRQQRDEIATMKRYTDNIFASIASGVITTDTQDTIVTFNRAAETILCTPAQQAVGHPYYQALDFLRYTPLPSLIKDVRQHRSVHVSKEISFPLPQGEQLNLALSLSTLLGSGGETLGVAIVVDDVTEKRRHEHERALVSRYLPSGLVDRLPQGAGLGMGQERRTITTLFADIRGFTSFSEINPPEQVIEVLNNYRFLTQAAVRFNWGIVDKYIGDEIMALFNTPLLELEDHAWQAVRMAWTLQQAVRAYHEYVPPEEQLSLGIGICTGEVVVGNVGTEERMEYTAIGDAVNLAKRLQDTARPGQILISHETWQRVQDWVRVKALAPIQVKGRQAFTRIYEVTGLIDPS